MKKIKILYVGLDTMPYIGGIETFILKTISEINKETFQIDFLSFIGDVPCFYEELKGMGANFFFVTKRSKNYIKNKKEIRNLLKSEQYDIVHCHQNSFSYITPCVEALKLGIKVIVHAHNAGCLQGIKSRILHEINKKRISRKKITCIAVSDYAGKWFFGQKKDYVVLNNGVEIDKFKFSEEKRKIGRKELNVGDRKIVLHVGAFRQQKNHQRIIEIFNDYIKYNPKACLVLVGEGKLKNEIMKSVSDKNLEDYVIFTGNRSDVDILMSAADVFLFPSYYEGFPIALLEAECNGLPCIISDVITTQVYIDDLCYPISLESTNRKWIEALESVRSSKRNIYSKSVEKKGFGINSEVNQLEKIYMDLIK